MLTMRLYHQRKAAGLCVSCGKPTDGVSCPDCRDSRRRYQRTEYARLKERRLCIQCRQPKLDHEEGVRCNPCANIHTARMLGIYHIHRARKGA